ncbi:MULTISPECIES: DUF397 domain-containing protein [Kitasatospora]|uniref:DUF397 domain-containing protein n=1 Tax=Kitasatospora cystarginea TaxID=58350 RepID=A0ABN3DC61_9ACTN
MTNEHDLYAVDLSKAHWKKSSKSATAPYSVEVAFFGDDAIAVRDSKDHKRPPLRFTKAEWIAFTHGVRSGEFDR